MNIGICDDDILQLKYIKRIISSIELNETINIYTFSLAQNLVDEIQKNAKLMDILFLDIEIGNDNGIDIAKIILSKMPNLIIIFISSYTQYVSRAFQISAFQYLIKPIDKNILVEELQRAIEKYKVQNMQIILHNQEEIAHINVMNIVYLESELKKVKIYEKNYGIHVIYGSLKEYWSTLKNYGFINCHHGFIVNMSYIRSISNDTMSIVLKETDENGFYISIPISKRRKKEVIEAWKKYILDL